MKTKKRQPGKYRGSALLLVVVVSVLLAVIGVMFLMVSRAGEAETGAVVQNMELDGAVDTVVGRIQDVLVNDLFGQKVPVPAIGAIRSKDASIIDGDRIPIDCFNVLSDEPWDAVSHYKGFSYGVGPDGIAGTADDTIGSDGTAGTWDDMIDPGANGLFDRAPAVVTNTDIWLADQLDDYWLASLEPVFVNAGSDGIKNTNDDLYVWPQITDLWGTLQAKPDSLYYQRFTNTDHVFYPQTSSVFWIDPDDDQNTAQWQGTRNSLAVSANNVRVKIVAPNDRVNVIKDLAPANVTEWKNPNNTAPYGARADADGDGVADSRWAQIPNLVTNRGETFFAAVRIIDNCAMLNLNAASCLNVQPYTATKISPFCEDWTITDDSVNPPVQKPWHSNSGSGTGRYLTELSYVPLLRGRDLNGNLFDATQTGGDYWYNLIDAKNFLFDPEANHQLLMHIENPAGTAFYDISDELELRNRYLVTSRAESRFELYNIANYTLDGGSGDYGALQVPRDKVNDSIDIWYERIDPVNFDKWNVNGMLAANTIPFKYDRRHICTFYSFDRNIRRGKYPILENDLATVATNANWTPKQIEQARKVFWPNGAITTNLASYQEMMKGPAGKPYNNAETRRRVVQLLYALREYYMGQGDTKNAAAIKAAQIVANIIDYSDDNAPATGAANGSQGPFYGPAFGIPAMGKTINYQQQANGDCTFITKQIVDDLIYHVCWQQFGAAVDVTLPNFTSLGFGLNATDIIFGYEAQPFISEVYANRNVSTGALVGFAIELLNPYSDQIDLTRNNSTNVAADGWKIKVGNGAVIDSVITSSNNLDVPAYNVFPANPANNSPGRYVVYWNATTATGPLPSWIFQLTLLSQMGALQAGNCDIQLLRPAPVNSGAAYICVDKVSSVDVRLLFQSSGQNAIKRDDTQWRFIYPSYELQEQSSGNYTHTLGQANGVTLSSVKGFQLAIEKGQPLQRWHELETLSPYGNDVSNSVSQKLTDPNAVGHMDLAGSLVPGPAPAAAGPAGSSGLLDYICTMNREIGTLPGRININTAPMHVIACAIPPTLADPAVGTGGPITFSALQMAKAIVDYREANGPYTQVSDLLNVWVDLNANKTADASEYVFKRYYTNGMSAAVNVGSQAIDDDIEERDWILSNLANKFTVRSDTFTAYILVRLGADGPQRRMIAIFDRSNVWTKNDLPRLVALHPVPAGESQ